MESRNFENQVVVVTGGSEGIGFGIASSLANSGAKVYLVARTEEKLKKAREEINRNGGDANILVGDVTNLEAMCSIIDGVYETNGRLDVFVNNAGKWALQTIGEDPQNLRNIRKLTGEAPMEINEYLVAKFKENGDKIKILNVVSQAGIKYMRGNLGYGVGKKLLAISILELQGELEAENVRNIHLYGLHPATVATPNVLPLIKSGKLQDATSLESVVNAGIDLLEDRTPTRHVYVGFVPGKGIVRKYLDVSPKNFSMFPQHGSDQIIDPKFTPAELSLQ